MVSFRSFDLIEAFFTYFCMAKINYSAPASWNFRPINQEWRNLILGKIFLLFILMKLFFLRIMILHTHLHFGLKIPYRQTCYMQGALLYYINHVDFLNNNTFFWIRKLTPGWLRNACHVVISSFQPHYWPFRPAKLISTNCLTCVGPCQDFKRFRPKLK